VELAQLQPDVLQGLHVNLKRLGIIHVVELVGEGGEGALLADGPYLLEDVINCYLSHQITLLYTGTRTKGIGIKGIQYNIGEEW
jgi:hypothetical protein